jgi:hypothetical protein
MRGVIPLEHPKTMQRCRSPWAFDIIYPNPTPIDVIATTRGKCPNSQSEYKPILPFSRRTRIGAPSTLSKYNHHKLNGMLRLKPNINIE